MNLKNEFKYPCHADTKYCIISQWYVTAYFQNYFNWRVITLQCYDDFCHTSTWISHRYTCVPPHPWASQIRCAPDGPSLWYPSTWVTATIQWGVHLHSSDHIRYLILLSVKFLFFPSSPKNSCTLYICFSQDMCILSLMCPTHSP